MTSKWFHVLCMIPLTTNPTYTFVILYFCHTLQTLVKSLVKFMQLAYRENFNSIFGQRFPVPIPWENSDGGRLQQFSFFLVARLGKLGHETACPNYKTYVMRSSKMSLKSKFFFFVFCHFLLG